MDAIEAGPRIAKVTLMHDGLLVEFQSGLVIFYRDAFLWAHWDYSRQTGMKAGKGE